MKTAGLISDSVKPDVALPSASQGSGGTTGRFISFKDGGKKLFLLDVGALTAVQTATLQLVQAKDRDGSDVKDIDNAAVTISNTTADVIAGAYKATITFDTLVAASEIVINGLTFTSTDGDTVESTRTFSIYGLDDDGVAAELAALINNTTYGVPGVKATAAGSGGVLTLEAEEPGEEVVGITGVASTATPAIVGAAAFVEVDSAALDDENDFTHVAAKVTNTANTQCSVSVVQTGRFSPAHDGMAGTKTDLEA